MPGRDPVLRRAGLTAEVADDLCDALDAIVTERVVRKAARESATVRLKFLPRLSRASLQLAKAAETLVEVLGNVEFSGADAASMLAEQISLPELRAAVDVVTELRHAGMHDRNDRS